jgi:membrane protease YdiL (CAAX protease family)
MLGVTDIWTLVGLNRAAWEPRGILVAAALGVAVVCLPALLLIAAGQARFEASASAESAAFMAWGALALLVPAALSEELLFRGFPFTATRDAIGTTWAVVLTSAAFGAAHLFNPGPTALTTIAVAAAGAFLALVRVATGSLAAAFVAHFFVNFAQLVVLHAPVSGQPFEKPGYRLVPTGPEWLTGGAWGPEGGAAVVVTMLAAIFLLSRAAGRWPPAAGKHHVNTT